MEPLHNARDHFPMRIPFYGGKALKPLLEYHASLSVEFACGNCICAASITVLANCYNTIFYSQRNHYWTTLYVILETWSSGHQNDHSVCGRCEPAQADIYQKFTTQLNHNISLLTKQRKSYQLPCLIGKCLWKCSIDLLYIYIITLFVFATAMILFYWQLFH